MDLFSSENDLGNDINDILLDVNNNKENKISKKDNKIIKLQEDLLMMGFEIDMINKVIMHFNITTVNEAIDYLLKSNDGMWHHPFVPSIKDNSNPNDDEEINNNNILDNVLNKVKTINNDLKFSKEDICDICGEIKEAHINEENIIKNNINNENSLFENNNVNDLPNKDNEENEKEKENNNICQICLGEIENPVEIENCKHKFCNDCFQDYLNNLINQNNIEKIPCPNIKCNNRSLSPDFFSHYITEQQLLKYRQFKTKNEIAKDKLKIFCPLCTSYSKIDNPDNYNPNNESYKKSNLICQNGHEFCSCGRPQHDGDCYHDGEEFRNLIIKEKIKKCPKCGFLIKKNSGCNHMICGNKACKFEFCWLCLQESLPGHYETGPCSGMQFVDPDSFFYRLEQKYPFLYYIFFFFKLILLIIGFCIFTCFPALLLWISVAFILNENFVMSDDDEDKLFILPKSLSIMHYIICIPILLSIQTVYYMALAICLIILSLYIVFYFFNAIYLLIMLCIYCAH